ncbi:MAG TPA: hypothetical protein VE994_05125 [Terriglobales bacterium]|nr:hypothetical protein [Terriglobales bacterium]
MKYVRFVPSASLLAVIVCAALLIGCGAGHPTIRSITVSPQTAKGTVNSGTVVYTATGNFTDNTSRQLTVADGLTWASSNTVVATIDDGGAASCKSIGTVTITATAPQNLTITVGTGINNSSTKISGTAQLVCQ